MPSSTPGPTRHTARHRTACALTGPAKIGAPLLLPLPLAHRSEPETAETHLTAPPKRSYQAATPSFSAEESTRCQVDLSPKTERSSQLQGFTPSTSSYRAPPLPAVHTAHPSMGLVPLQGFETTAGCPTGPDQPPKRPVLHTVDSRSRARRLGATSSLLRFRPASRSPQIRHRSLSGCSIRSTSA
jgi:hypothetical protein